MDNGPELTEYANKTIGVYGGKFFPPHKGHISFALEAAKLVDILFVNIQYDQEYEKKLCEGTNFKPITPRQRERWLTEIFKNHPNIRVMAQYEHRSDQYLTDPLIQQTYDELRETTGHIDVIFSNTHDYDNYFQKWIPEAQHIVLLEDRNIYPISATKIREEGPYAHWESLPEPVQKHYLKRVAFCGWESSGKTYSTQQIAQQFHTTFVPEYGRTYYVDEIGGYADIAEPEDYIDIMAGHLQQLRYANGNKILCVDTDLIYTQFFHQQLYGTLHPILDLIIKQNIEKIDTYLFFEPYTFNDDGTRYRFTETERQQTSDQLKTLYAYYNRELIVINGTGSERLNQVEHVMNQLIQK